MEIYKRSNKIMNIAKNNFQVFFKQFIIDNNLFKTLLFKI